jgi:hypothetical protein
MLPLQSRAMSLTPSAAAAAAAGAAVTPVLRVFSPDNNKKLGGILAIDELVLVKVGCV